MALMLTPRGKLSKKVLLIRYVHEQDGKAYQHDFRNGVELQVLSDGSVRLYRPDGQRLWDEFPD